MGVQLPNSCSACAVELGIASVGGVSLPYPMSRESRESEVLLARSDAVAAIMARGKAEALRESILRRNPSALPALRHLLVANEGTEPSALEHWDLAAGEWEGQGAAGRAVTNEGVQPGAFDADGPVRILVSSGTESNPKMVLYSHNAMAGARGNFIRNLRAESDPMRMFFLVPMGSAYGSNVTSAALARNGATVVLRSGKFDPEATLRMIHEQQPTHVLGVPTMFRMLAETQIAERIETASVEVAAIGGSPLDSRTAYQAEQSLGCRAVHVYGSADGVNCHTRLNDPARLVHETVGRPDPSVANVQVCDEDGEELPPGDRGEIWALGPITPMCYVDDSVREGRCRVVDGWTPTGDIGMMTREGHLTVVGRLKDVILRGGENISPEEVEGFLYEHPDVLQAACVGLPDERLGERVGAALVLRKGASAPTLDDIRGFLHEWKGLSKTKLPEQVTIEESLPVNAGGKVMKDGLRARMSDCGA